MLFFAFIFLLICGFDAKGLEDSNKLMRGDLNFFFESVFFKNGGWEFRLSPNTHGMIWRTISPKLDLTGTCESGKIVEVSAGTSFEIKRKDLSFVFRPYGNRTFEARLTIKPDKIATQETESRWALVSANPNPVDGNVYIAFPED